MSCTYAYASALTQQQTLLVMSHLRSPETSVILDRMPAINTSYKLAGKWSQAVGPFSRTDLVGMRAFYLPVTA